MDKPTSNPVSFVEMVFNSLKLSAGTAVCGVLLGGSAAYAFSRFHFRFRATLMLGILALVMLPGIVTLLPLFALLNGFQVGEFNLRNSLWGVGLVLISEFLPFSIWNLTGYLNTIPREFEEAAHIDGANSNQNLRHIILPLAMPGVAVTAFFGAMLGWTDFYISWQFLTNPKDFTMAMGVVIGGLYKPTGLSQTVGTGEWQTSAAFAILNALPPIIIYFCLQKYIKADGLSGGLKF
jgi:arabinogalactan oligomer/maltooligosaccharide transport system permease protein